ncbi:MAG: hypothetical protein ACRCW2_07115 [Cellulosilyticaceae bacterium]
MANLQKIKNGKRTYAITPHIPGGFITPDQLIKIGEVTKKYKGVLKITSGQRILITQLQLEDIPTIWEELGMEPAVREQNSVKNVEMCPAGFCKRSKVNSIGIGMKLSHRYQWAEMPCRTKIGVAGCRNACGSVYSKDIGVIGDKDGYMLTIGGSAGFHPRQADIVATGLTERETLQMITGFISFYREQAIPGEKIGFFVDRMGIQVIKNQLGVD